MLSQSFERTLHRAFSAAADRNHEYVTAVHLLLALTEDPDASAIMLVRGVDVSRLQGRLDAYLQGQVSQLAVSREPKPAADVQKTIQRTAIKVQSAGRDQVTGADVLISLLSEAGSDAVRFLADEGMI
jgi:ATP-dependent Clp protease ATP-binding subunit ClpA